ncbi:hypothetical protein [Clostridium botulinum]|uniref:hypothetical protein n=1 Tax=Clostridium botulinum TaxID=1491 RepID=UPI0004D3563E|nr:hypothetical protein [Clostridium botulinum]KEI01230.1 ribonuclease BN [Clostridium botulinum D str. 16868]
MTEIFCAIDHVLLLDDYKDPDKHKHWAKHLLISLNGQIECFVEDKSINCEGIMISSNIVHTVKSNRNDVLVYLFDETTDIAKDMEEKYLKYDNYYILSSVIVQKIKKIWNENMTNKKDVQ